MLDTRVHDLWVYNMIAGQVPVRVIIMSLAINRSSVMVLGEVQ